MTNEKNTDPPEGDGPDIPILTEDGIRVRGGSVVLSTVVPDGFERDDTDPNDRKIKTKRLKGPYTIAVNHGTCTPSFTAVDVVKVALTITDSNRNERRVVLGDAGPLTKKRTSFSAAGFTLAGGTVTTDDPTATLTRIEAFDDGSPPVLLLSCEPRSADVPMEVDLRPK